MGNRKINKTWVQDQHSFSLWRFLVSGWCCWYIEENRPRAEGWVGVELKLEGARGQARLGRWGCGRNLDFKWPT